MSHPSHPYLAKKSGFLFLFSFLFFLIAKSQKKSWEKEQTVVLLGPTGQAIERPPSGDKRVFIVSLTLSFVGLPLLITAVRELALEIFRR
jgi:hypothetical protein